MPIVSFLHNNPHSVRYHTERKGNIRDKGVERTLRAEELAGDVEGLTSHNDDLLTVEQLLGDSAGQTTEEVSFAVDDDLFPTIQVSHRFDMPTLMARVAALQLLGKNAPLIRRRTSW